jgi:hypothetical protein
MRRTTLGAVAVTGLILGLAGCGEDAEAITKDEFVERADAVCREAQDEFDEVFESMWAEFEDLDENDATDQQQMFVALDETMDAVVPRMHTMADELRELGAPEGDEELLSELLADLDAAIDEFDAMTDAAVAGDEAAREYLDGEGDPAAIDIVNRRAQDYGLDVCGAGS